MAADNRIAGALPRSSYHPADSRAHFFQRFRKTDIPLETALSYSFHSYRTRTDSASGKKIRSGGSIALDKYLARDCDSVAPKAE